MSNLIRFEDIDAEQFEVLCRELLVSMGAQKVAWTGRGPDRGRDLSFTEICQGIISRYERKWLVQCKHSAKSGRSITVDRLGDSLVDRCMEHQADAYLLICSVAPSSGVMHQIEGINDNPRSPVRAEVWDRDVLERYLCEDGNRTLLARFFPMAHARITTGEPAADLVRRLKMKGFTSEQIAEIAAMDDNHPRLELAERLASAETTSEESRVIKGLLVDFVLMGTNGGERILDGLDALPAEGYLDFFTRTVDIDESGAEALIGEYSQRTGDAGRKVNSIQLLIDHFHYGFSEVYPLLEGLDSVDIDLILSHYSFDVTVQDAFHEWIMDQGSPNDFLNELSTHTSIGEALVEQVFYSCASGTLIVEGEFSLSLALQWGSDRDFAHDNGAAGRTSAEGSFRAVVYEETKFDFTITELRSKFWAGDAEDEEEEEDAKQTWQDDEQT